MNAPAARQQHLAQLVHGIGADLRDYRVLQGLLDEQFEAALRHRAAPLAELAERITESVETLDLRRRDRIALVEQLAGASATIDAAFALISPGSRATLEAGWHALEDLVRECQRLNARNGRLMADQHSIMQRVLYGEEGQTYAPA